ncbi:MAG TPA: diguanylate cyclase [Terracidiphilus sp.]|nr:diguanylate cyclase [Terracidiphilus sp.]
MQEPTLSTDLQSGATVENSRLAQAFANLRPDSVSHMGFVILLYLLVSLGGNALTRTPGVADIIWPANGLLLAVLLRLPRRCWTIYLAASIVANVIAHSYFHFPVSQSLLFSAGNTIEVLVAASLLANGDGSTPDLARLKTLVRFLFYGVLLAPLTSSAFIELVAIFQKLPTNVVSATTWFIGDVMGIAVVTPLVLAIDGAETAALFARGKRLETLSILIGLCALSTLVFAMDGLPVDFLLIPALLLAIFRLGSSGSAIGIILMTGPAVYMTERNHGAFALARADLFIHSIFILQCFLCVALILLYSVNSALKERDRLQQAVTAAFFEADANAGRDHLTGLANRRAFDKQIVREWQRAFRERLNLSLLMIDVDRFKLYNDHYGHPAGDECLRKVASILAQSALRATDLVARYGGEEFAVILPGASVNMASLLAERIRQAVAEVRIPHAADPQNIVTISAGVATLQPSNDMETTMLIERADRALYEAKNRGRDRVEKWSEAGW